MKLGRRQFLLGGIAILLAGVGKQYHDAKQMRIQKIIMAVFQKRLYQLAWTQEDRVQFVQDFMQHPRNRGFLKKVQLLSYFYPIYAYSNILENSLLAPKIRQFEEVICTRFLLSTDFFYHNNPNKIKYLTYYDPRVMPCANPLR